MKYLKKEHYRIYIIYTMIILFVYFPLITQHFAMTDDYAMIDIAISRSGNLLEWDIQNGRPIYGLFQYLVQYYMVNITDMSWLRFFSVITTVFLCCFIYIFLFYKVKNLSKNFILYLPLFLVFIPSIVVYNSWAVCFVFILSLLLAGLAYYIMFDEDRNTTVWKFIIGVTLLLCSFLIYQATAMFFLYFVFLNYCIDNRKIKVSTIFYSIVALMISMLFSFFAIKLLPKLLYGYNIERSNLNTDILSKVYWFFDGPLKLVINNYNITPNVLYTFVSILFIFCGFFYIYKEHHGILKILLTVLLMIAIMAPSLLAKESWTATRSSVGLYFIVITIIFYGLLNVYEKFLSQYKVKVILIGMLFVICVYTQHYIYSAFIRQQQSEYQALTQEIMSVVPKQYTGKIRFDISNNFRGAFTKIQLADEIGATSIQTPWALKGIARSIKKLKGFNYQIDDSNLILESHDDCKKNCIIIHCADILKKAANYK